MLFAKYISTIRNWLTTIQRHHALEHATIHMITKHYPRTRVAGRSDNKGFYLYTDLPISVVEKAVNEGLQRLHSGQHSLAIHPNCGTNILTTGILTASAAFLVLSANSEEDSWCQKLDRLTTAILAATFAAIVAKPLGTSVQRHITTRADVSTIEGFSIKAINSGRHSLYRVRTH